MYSPNSYEASVMAAANDQGLLSPGDARKLLRDHGIRWDAWLDEKPMGALPCEALPLLHYLGY